MASTVWGMTPSSAATTMAAMSVTLAPRARMAVKASWPGVSRNVIGLAVVLDLVGADVLGDAAGLAGGHLGLADGVEQVVLPWSTWPMTVITGGRALEVFGAVVGSLVELALLVGRVRDLDGALEVVGEDGDRLVGQRLRDGRHLTVAHHRLDDLGGGDAEQLRDVLDAGARGHLDDLAFDRRRPAPRRRGRPAGGGRGGRGGRPAVRVRGATPERRSRRGGGGCRRRRRDAPGGRRPTLRVGLVDDVLVDLELALGELHAGALRVGEHVFDGRAALAGDLSDRFHAGHSPHRLSLLADVGEAPAQIVVDEDARAQRAIERAPARRPAPNSPARGHSQAPRPRGARRGEHDTAVAQREPHECVARRDPPATDTRAPRSADMPLRAVTPPSPARPVSASASFWCAGMPQ